MVALIIVIVIVVLLALGLWAAYNGLVKSATGPRRPGPKSTSNSSVGMT